MINKTFLLIMFLTVLSLSISGCHNSSIKKIENTTKIVIGYDINSYIAIIRDKQEIKQLEDLFNNAEFTKSDTDIQMPYLRISFSGKSGSRSFHIDKDDIIQLYKSGNCIKSRQITFDKLYSIFNEYSTNKK